MNAPKVEPGKSLDEIRSTLRSEMPRLREDHSVRSLEIFGSFVRGEASPESDLDVLVGKAREATNKKRAHESRIAEARAQHIALRRGD